MLVLSLCQAPCPVSAQTGTSVKLGAEEGLSVRRDSTFLLRFHFRMQNRAVYLQEAGKASRADGHELLVRRFRLKAEGFVLSPKLEYKVLLGLSHRDMDLGDERSAPDPLLDALVLYRIAPHTKVGFGQGKVPGGRQALVSSGDMELPERPLANAAYTLDRDLGLFAWQQWGRHLHVLAAITQGEGRASGQDHGGLCYTGRLEWLPFGAFADAGEYVEGDLQREARPKLALAAAYSSNRRGRRARAQQGPWFPDGQERDINTLFADAIFKWQGWSWQCEFSRRCAEGAPAVLDTAAGAWVTVNEGWGFTGQLGRLFGPRSQVVARCSVVRPDATVRREHADRDEAVLGYSYYLNGHRIKLQAALSYYWGEGHADIRWPGNTYGAMLQVELGI